MGKRTQAPVKAKPAWDKRAAIEKSRTKHLNQLSKLKKLRTRLEGQGKAKPLIDVKDNVEALERELFGSPSQDTQQQQQQQQQQQLQLQQQQPLGHKDGQLSTSGRQEPSNGIASHEERRLHKRKKEGRHSASQSVTDGGPPAQSCHQHDDHEQPQQQQQQHESSHQGQGDSAPHIGNARRRQRPPGKHMSKTQVADS